MKKTKEAIAVADSLEERATKILFKLFDFAQRQKNFCNERIDEIKKEGKDPGEWIGKTWMEFGMELAYHQAATRLGLDTSQFKFHEESSLAVWFFTDDKTKEKAKQSSEMRALLTKEGVWFEEFKNGRDGIFNPKEWNLPCIMSGGQTFQSLQEIGDWVDYIKHVGSRRVKILPKP